MPKEGFDKVRKGQQFSGIEGKDVIGLDGIHVEVKGVERLNINKAMDQAIKDNKNNDISVVAHRKNYGDWLITMKASDWFYLYKAWINS